MYSKSNHEFKLCLALAAAKTEKEKVSTFNISEIASRLRVALRQNYSTVSDGRVPSFSYNLQSRDKVNAEIIKTTFSL